MKGSPRSSGIRPWDLPGVRALRDAPRVRANLGLDWAAVVFCTFGAPPALVLAGLMHPTGSPVALWLSAVACFFTGLTLSLRLRPLPPRPVFAARAWGDVPEPATSPRVAAVGLQLHSLLAEPEAELSLPGVRAGMSRAELLEQLAKLREQGDLSNAEYAAALDRVVREHGH
ncbi:MAG: hypothetical protein HKP30_05315 [Myxococcales bacterium]|nr:hypothetical protein [Myxococcales bacterium]